MIDINKIKKSAEKDFEKTWVETAKLLPKNTKIEIKGKGKAHPVRNMMQKLRRVLLYAGFDEIENKTILPDSDVYKQYGPEAPVILDRAFYLAKMPRPDIGLSEKKIAQIKKIIGKFDTKKVQGILRSYKKGEIEGDDFVEELVKGLKIKTEKATQILDQVFSEFKNLKPQPTNLTLRSHMTATWYHTLAALQNKSDFPLALFSVGPRYRNEQKEDKGHLRVHHSASLVIMDSKMSLEAGRKITEELLKKFGFDKIKFETKKATSKYYANGQEEELFVKHNGEWLEIADIGMYSPISLANFGIKYPVFNAGLGVERLVMVLEGYKDIRKLVYPQFGEEGGFSDEELAKSITCLEKPKTEKGKKIAEAIENTARKNKDKIAPCEFVAYKDNKLSVAIIEKEKDKKLIGPAGFNEVFVKDGNIYADVKTEGSEAGINFMKSVANKIAYKIETSKKSFSYKRKIVKSLSNVNLKISDSVSKFINSNNKKIDIYGPMFLEVVVKYKK